MGYGTEIYKIAILNIKQRDDLVTELKVMPGHKAKLAGFFTVVEELYPRHEVAE